MSRISTGRVIAVILLLAEGPAAGEGNRDWRAAYGERWLEAEAVASELVRPLGKAAGHYGLDPEELTAVVFPEFLRRSALRDRLERSALFACYISLGSGTVDFSAGPLQMRPSFVESLEAAMTGRVGEVPNPFCYPAGMDEEGIRRTRLDRIYSMEWAAEYLAAMADLLCARFDLDKMQPVERVRFLAAAYNAGFDRPRESILASASWQLFPGPSGDQLAPRVSYCDLAIEAYIRR